MIFRQKGAIRSHVLEPLAQNSRSLTPLLVVIREKIPSICAGLSDGKADQLELYLTNKLKESTRDGTVKEMEEQAGGLMMYAMLLDKHLRNESVSIETCDFLFVSAQGNRRHFGTFRRRMANARSALEPSKSFRRGS